MKRHEVSTWEALMAVRYGMGRMTAANTDAARLAQRIWDHLNEGTRDSVRRDAAHLTGVEREAWAWLFTPPTRPVGATTREHP